MKDNMEFLAIVLSFIVIFYFVKANTEFSKKLFKEIGIAVIISFGAAFLIFIFVQFEDQRKFEAYQNELVITVNPDDCEQGFVSRKIWFKMPNNWQNMSTVGREQCLMLKENLAKETCFKSVKEINGYISQFDFDWCKKLPNKEDFEKRLEDLKEMKRKHDAMDWKIMFECKCQPGIEYSNCLTRCYRE